MTRIGPWTCQHYNDIGCVKHQNPSLTRDVGHSCCGRCSEGVTCKETAWGSAPLFPHAFEAVLIDPEVCMVCKQGPH